MWWCATTSTPRRRGRRVRCWCTGPSKVLAGIVEGGAVRRARRPGHAGGIHHRQRTAAAVSGGGDLQGGTPTIPATHPYLVDTDAMARVDGGPEALLRLDERRRLLGQPPLGPMLLTGDARARGPDVAPRKWGHRDRHPAGARNGLRPRRRSLVGDSDTRRSAAHVQPRARLSRRGRRNGVRAVERRTHLGVELGVGFDRAAQRRTGDRACGGRRRRFVDELGVQCPAVGRRPVAAGRLRPSRHQRHAHDHAQRNRRRRAGPPHRGVDRSTAPARCGSTRPASR